MALSRQDGLISDCCLKRIHETVVKIKMLLVLKNYLKNSFRCSTKRGAVCVFFHEGFVTLR